MLLTRYEVSTQRSGHNTGKYVSNSLRAVCGLFKVQLEFLQQGLWDRACNLSPLFERLESLTIADAITKVVLSPKLLQDNE